MENNELRESLKKIKSLITFTPGMTLTENEKLIEEQYAPGVATYASNLGTVSAAKVASKIPQQKNQEKVYTDFDKIYDYKLSGNMWYTKRKNKTSWISLKNYPEAIKKLNARYGVNVPI